MRIKLGSTIFDSASTTSTVAGTAMSTLRLWCDSNPMDAGAAGPVVFTENEDHIALRFFLTYQAADVATLKANCAIIANALADPPGTSVTVESAAGTTLREWLQSSQDYIAATGSFNEYHSGTTEACFEVVITLAKTPFRGAGGTSLTVVGRAGPHSFDLAYDTHGFQTIVVRANFVPLGDGTSARANAIAWAATVTARTAANLSWLPTAANAHTVDVTITGADDFDSKTLGTVEAAVTLRQIAPDLIALDVAARAINVTLSLSPRERGGPVDDSASVNPGYDFSLSFSIDWLAVSGTTDAYPSESTISTAVGVLVTAAFAKVRGGPSSVGQALIRSCTRTVDASGGRLDYTAIGVTGTNPTELEIVSFFESKSVNQTPRLDIVPAHDGTDVLYIGSEEDRTFVAHTLNVTRRGSYYPYRKPPGLSSLYIPVSFNPDFQSPVHVSPKSESVGSTGVEMGPLYPVSYTAIYQEVRTSSRTKQFGPVLG